MIYKGLTWGLCHSDAYEMDRRLELFYYINYLFKFYELLVRPVI
jgi:hypothetical protein